MRNRIYKLFTLLICLFISVSTINAATASGSATLVNIRNTTVNGHNYKTAGLYNTTMVTYTTKQEKVQQSNFKPGQFDTVNSSIKEYGCKMVIAGTEGRNYYCTCENTGSEKYSCTLTRTNECNTLQQNNCRYTLLVNKEVKVPKTVNATTGTYIFHYQISNSTKSDTKNAYCIQPSKNWPGSSSQTALNYTLNRTVDVRNCKSIGDRSIGYPCGLAEIFYQAKKGTYKSLANENNNYHIIGAALRMWVVYWYKFTNYRNMSGIEQRSICGEGSCVTGSEYTSKPVYENTVRAVMLGYTGSSCSSVSKKYGNGSNHGILCWTDENSKYSVQNIIKLFNYVRLHQNDKIQDNRFGNADDDFDIKTYIKEKQKLATASDGQTKWNMTIDVRVDENVKKQIYAKCNPKDESGCSSLVEVIDAYGKSIGYCSGNDVNNGKSCFKINFNDPDYSVSGKDSYLFTFKVYNYKVCVLTSKEGEVGLYLTKPGVTFKLKGGSTGFATVRQYIHNTSPNNYQVMMTYIDDYKKFDGAEINIPGKAKEYHFPFDLSDISCDPAKNCDKNSCSNLNKNTDINGKDGNSSVVSDTCNSGGNDAGKEFSYKTIEDPQMSCILNNCDPKATEEYDVTNKLGVNSAFCHVYCRDEVRFYIPSPTSVLAGMQFNFDLGNSLRKFGAIERQNDSSKKLTAVVVKYKQCTSVFNQTEFNNSASKNKVKEREVCLMGKELKEKLLDAKNEGFSYDSNKEPITLSVNYEEGNKVEIKSSSKKTTESISYCKNNCYKVNQTKTKQSCETNLNNFSSTKPSINSGDIVYSTMLIRVQNDYYVDTEYSYEPITGKVSINNRKTKVPKYNYPVSIETPSGKYNISYKFNNISKDSTTGYNTFNYSCYYNVYNTTKKNDCDYKSNNSIDISKCSNACFEIDNNGNTVIDKNCIKWKENNKYSLGISYRNVSLKNLFPVARGNRSNWYYMDEVNNPYAIKNGIINRAEKESLSVGALVKKTQDVGNNIYNKEHLEASYKLTTETIKNIKKYNKNNNNTYLNDTSINCVEVKRASGGKYYRCGSSFLNEIKDSKVGGN